MIDPTNPIVQALIKQGYRIALHAYLQPDGRVKITTVGKHAAGKLVQGWNSNGDPGAAFKDMAKRAGIAT